MTCGTVATIAATGKSLINDARSTAAGVVVPVKGIVFVPLR